MGKDRHAQVVVHDDERAREAKRGQLGPRSADVTVPPRTVLILF